MNSYLPVEYRVEKTDEPGTLGCAYKVFGPRGTEYGLIRNQPNPLAMFVINLKTVNPNAKLRGCGWWTDKDGKLKPLR